MPRSRSATDQFAAGRSCYQQLVTLARPVPDDPDQIHQIVRIGELAPDLAIGAQPAIILEIVAIDLVRQRRFGLRAGAAQPHHLGDDDVGGGVGGIEQPVQRRIEQIIADHHDARMLLRLRPVIGHDVAHRQAAWQRVHRRQPAMDPAFHEMRAGVAERRRQRFHRGFDQFLVGEIGKGERVGTGDQPVQHAVLADVVAGALIVDAAAAERLRHEPGALDLVAPERLVEQERDAQIVRRTVEIGDVLDHRPAQLLAVPAQRRQPGMRQAHQHEIELVRLRPLAVHHVEPIAAGRRSCRP